MDASYTVRFGADTADLKQGSGEATGAIKGIDGTLSELNSTLKLLQSSIQTAFKAPPTSGGVKKEAKDTTDAVDRLIRSIQAETNAWKLNKTERNATLRTMNQTQALERQGVKVTDAMTAAIQRQNMALAQTQAGKGGGANVGFMGLRPHEIQNLTYQVNDFFTQIASGSSVMQASAQQGGQVFQIFQSQVGALLRFLPAIGLAAVLIGGSLAGLSRLQNDTAMLRDFTAQTMASADGGRYMAEALSDTARELDVYGSSLDDARANLAQFMREGVQSDKLVEFGKAAQDMADVFKLEVTDAAEQVSEAFTGNYEDIVELDDAINFLTADERELIREMMESGEVQAARTMAFERFRAVIGESADYQRGPAADAARALEQAWDGLMGKIANSSIIVNTMNELRTLIGLLERALELTGAAVPAEGARSGSFGARFRSPEAKSDPLPWWMGGGTPSIRRPEWTYPEFWNGGTPDFNRTPPPAPAPSLQQSRPSDGSIPGLQQSRVPLRQSLAPTPESQAQLKAEQALTLEYQRQAEANGTLTAAQRLNRAEREAMARAARAGLNDEGAARVVAAARAAEQAKIDKEEERAGARKSRSATAARERETREAFRLAQEALRDRLETLDTEQAAVEDDFQRALQIQDQKLAAIREFYGEDSREFQNALQQKMRIQRQFDQQQEQLARIRTGAEAAIAQTQAEADAAARAAALSEERASIQQQLDTRMITQEQAIMALADVRRREVEIEADTARRIHEIRMNQLREQLKSNSLSLTEKASLDARILEMEAQFQATMAGIRRQSDAITSETSRQTAQSVHDTWRSRVEPIGQAFSGMFTGLATQTQTFGETWQRLGQTLLNSVDQWVSEQITKWMTAEAIKLQAAVAGEAARTGVVASGTAARAGVEAAGLSAVLLQSPVVLTATAATEAGRTGITAAGVAARTGLEATGATTTIAMSGAVALADVANSAIRAAAGAYAAIAGIPVIGPVLAPIMAGVALAAVLALGSKVFSAEGGWGEVPHDGAQTVLHKKEMVLPAQYATPLRRMLTSSQPTGGLGVGRGVGEPAGGINGQSGMMDLLQQAISRPPMQVSISAIDRRGIKRLLEERGGDLQSVLEGRARDLKFSGG